MKTFLNNLLRFGISGALLWWLYTQIDVAETVKVVKSADWIYIFYGFLIFAGINAVLILRWFVFIRAMDLKVPVVPAIRYYLFGLFGNLFLPSAIGGDLIKIWGVCQMTNEKPKVVASVLLDRLSGFGGIVTVATISFIFGFQLLKDTPIIWMILMMAAVSITIVLLLFNRNVYAFFSKIFVKFPKIEEAFMKMHQDISLTKGHPECFLQSVALSCLSQLLLALCFFFISRALHQELPLIYFIIFIPLICVVSTVPSIGGLGVREGGAAYFFGKVGMAKGIALSMSLMSFLFMVVVGLLGGLYFLLTKNSTDVKS